MCFNTLVGVVLKGLMFEADQDEGLLQAVPEIQCGEHWSFLRYVLCSWGPAKLRLVKCFSELAVVISVAAMQSKYWLHPFKGDHEQGALSVCVCVNITDLESERSLVYLNAA